MTLSQSSNYAVTVNYTVGGTATGGGADHSLAAGQVTFSAGQTTKNIPVPIVDDAADEGDETVVITLTAPSRARLGSITAHTVTIQDNDETLTVSVVGSGSVSPSGGTFPTGDSVSLAATPASGWLFSHWSGDLSGNTNPGSLTMDSNKAVTAHFVTIAKIQCDLGTGYIDVPSPLYVGKGQSVTFKAIPEPTGESWPSGKPAWGGTSGASGAGETTSVTFNTASTSSTDYKTVTAECGATLTVNVLVLDVEFKSVQFTSDHGTLRQGTSWLDGGQLYGEPEYTETHSYPISQTKGTTVSVALTLKVIPAGVDFQIAGTATHAFMDFASGAVQSTGTDQSVGMATDPTTGKLPDAVGTLTEDINWVLILSAANLEMDLTSSSHMIYLTYGTPDPAADNTDFRLNEICAWADGAGTNEEACDGIGPNAVGRSTFNPTYSIFAASQIYKIDPIWEVQDTGGGCISQVTFMHAAVQLLGATGGTVGYVHARHNSWTDLWNTSYTPETHATHGALGYVHGGDFNFYEACYKVGTKYWMGGTGAYGTKAVTVLHTVADPNNSATGNRQCYENNQGAYVTYPPPPEPTY